MVQVAASIAQTVRETALPWQCLLVLKIFFFALCSNVGSSFSRIVIRKKKNFSLFTSSSILPSSHCSRINQIICLCHFSSHFLSLSHALSRRKITHVRFNELIFSLSLFLSLTHMHTLSHTVSHLTVFECNNSLTLSILRLLSILIFHPCQAKYFFSLTVTNLNYF